MKKIYNSSKLTRNIFIAFIFAFFMVAGGCYTIAYIIQPTEVTPNSSFDVKICVKPDENWASDELNVGYGILGILLPKGWTVKDSARYLSAVPQNFYASKGFFCYNNDVVSFLKNAMPDPPSGYYWWGAKSTSMISLTYFDSGYVNVTIKTDAKIGEFNVKYVLGDDNEWNKSFEYNPYTLITKSEFIPVRVGITTNNESVPLDAEWEVYPNPATNQVTFTWNNYFEKLNLKIYQVTGACVSEKEINSNETVSLGNIPKGMYLYQLADKKQILKTGKLVIR
jgi:uncharacterized protein YceK